MTVLTSDHDPNSAAAQDNRKAMLAAIDRVATLACPWGRKVLILVL